MRSEVWRWPLKNHEKKTSVSSSAEIHGLGAFGGHECKHVSLSTLKAVVLLVTSKPGVFEQLVGVHDWMRKSFSNYWRIFLAFKGI